MGLFFCNYRVPSGGDGRQWHTKCIACFQSTLSPHFDYCHQRKPCYTYIWCWKWNQDFQCFFWQSQDTPLWLDSRMYGDLKLSQIYFRRRQWQPTPVLLPEKSHRWRSLVGCSPWGREESDTTERLHFHFSLSCIGEGNGNPLQCSCLENLRDGGAWWAASMGSHRVRHDWSDLAAAAAAAAAA